MYKIAILVVIYNKELNESETLQSLSRIGTYEDNVKVVLWNNGPSPLKSRCVKNFEKTGYNFEFKETIHNESLAVIYNQFLSICDAEKYILLDDDSSITSCFIKDSSVCSYSDVGMPIITSHGKIRTPTINGVAYSYGHRLDSTSKVFTIGTGLVIGREIVEVLKNAYGDVFDERFYLYGVDTTFCLRINETGLTNKVKFIDGFEHSLSRLEDEPSRVKNFRRKERSYDLGLMLRYYHSPKKAIKIFLEVFAVAAKRSLLNQERKVYIFDLCLAFISGKHYRNINNQN